MATCPLAAWVQVVQALGVLLIAGFGAWIASNQMRTARTKLQHDLYDRRFGVFEATKDLLFAATKNEDMQIHDRDFLAFDVGTKGADFLFKNDVIKRFLCEIRARAIQLQSVESRLRTKAGCEDRQRLAEASAEHREWLAKQIERLPKIFDELSLAHR